jgi:hypothetical protein
MPSFDYLLALAAWIAGLVIAGWWLLRRRRVRRRAKQSVGGLDAGLGGVLVLAALTVPELWFAFVYDATDSFSQTNVSKKWFARHVTPNKAGYRDDRELPAFRERDRVYIGFVGDSFTFGHGVRRTADRFTDRVARELEATCPGRTVVFNTGLPGLEIRGLTDEMVPELIRTGTPLDVLVYVFVPNDIEYLDERTAAFYQAQQARSPQFFLFRDTYFYNWLYYRLGNLRASPRGDYYGYLAEAYAGPPWPRFAGKLDELHRLCGEHDIELRVAVFPFLTTLGADDPFAPAYERLVSHCAASKIPCLDLRSALLPNVSRGLVVSRFDAHPNERAHKLAAEGLLAELKSRCGVDGPSDPP